MKKLIVPLALLGMAVLLLAAVSVDCVRLAAAERHRVALADEEMQKHEARLVKLLQGSTKISSDVQAAVKSYQAAIDPHARHDAYEQIVSSFRQTMEGGVDPTNPLHRKFMDDVAGAINRREIAEKQYDEEFSAYRSFLGSLRGSVARTFSSQARDDWQPGA